MASFITTSFLISTLLLSFLLINSDHVSAAKALPAARSRSSAASSSSATSTSTSSSSSTCVHELSRNVIRRCLRLITRAGSTADEPSADCCDAVRKAKLLPCLCSYITRDMEDLVDVGKVIGVFTSCGKKVRAGTKCASYTVPREDERREAERDN